MEASALSICDATVMFRLVKSRCYNVFVTLKLWIDQ